MQKADLSNVSSSFLAEVLGVTRDAVSKLYATGVIRQNGVARGKYSLFDAVPAYLDHLRDNKGSDVNVRLKLAQCEKIEIANKNERENLVETDVAAEVFRVVVTAWRKIAASVPKRIASRISKSENPDEIRTILCKELDGIGSELEKGLNQAIQGATNEGQN